MKNPLIFCLLFCFVSLSAQEKPQDFLSSKFHHGRRDALREQMPANSVAVFFANAVRNRANDVDYVYHQDPNFYYLTGYREPHSVLLIFKEFQPGQNVDDYNEIIFVQPRRTQNPEDRKSETWTGKRLGPNGVNDELAINQAFNNFQFEDYNIDFSKFDKVLFSEFFDDIRDTEDEGDLYDLIAWFKEKANFPTTGSLEVETPASNLDATTLNGILYDLREIKTADELDLLRKAVDISCIAQVEVMKAMKPGMSELEIQGLHEFIYKKYQAEYEGYPSIIGSGHNGCILHYIENYKPSVESKDMILMDLGAEYHGYTADVTRTIPIDGIYSNVEKAIYNLVLKAQEAAMSVCKPGISLSDLDHKYARKVINQGLFELGIISAPDQKHFYYPHSLGHHIGLDVHDNDVNSKLEPLKPNMAITIEPGIYIPEGSDCDQKWWGIAVRIEDDFLITEDGFELLSDKAPRTSDEIESLMAKPSPLDGFNLPNLDE